MTLSSSQKAELYDQMMREIVARKPSIDLFLGNRRHHYPPEKRLAGLLRAFDLAVEAEKRRILKDEAPQQARRVS